MSSTITIPISKKEKLVIDSIATENKPESVVTEWKPRMISSTCRFGLKLGLGMCEFDSMKGKLVDKFTSIGTATKYVAIAHSL